MKNYHEKLINLYGSRPSEDVFGRRPVSPAEIVAWISGDFSIMEPYYPPTEVDVAIKLPGERIPECQKHHHRRTGK